MKIKKKEKPLLKEGVYGTTKPPKKKFKKSLLEVDLHQKQHETVVVSPKPSKVSDIQIDFDSLSLNETAKNLKLDNVVEVPEELLKTITSLTEQKTHELNDVLLTSVTPLILAYTSSMNYVRAVLSDSLHIEIEEDTSMEEAIKDITRIEVLNFVINSLKVSKRYKVLLLSHFIDKLTTNTVARMEKSLSSKSLESRLKMLEAVMVRGYSKSKEQQTPTEDRVHVRDIPNPVAVRKRRHNV